MAMGASKRVLAPASRTGVRAFAPASKTDRTMRTGVTALCVFFGWACGDHSGDHPRGNLKDSGALHGDHEAGASRDAGGDAGPTGPVDDGGPKEPVDDDGGFEPGMDAAILDASVQPSDAGEEPSDSGPMDASDEAPRFQEVYDKVIAVRCAFCHHPDTDGDGSDSAMIGYTLGRLDMHDVDAAYANLVGDGGGVLAAGIHCGPPESNAGYKRVIPGDFANSVIYTKVTTPICGVRMPDGLPPLDDAGIALIRDWIHGGAK